MNESFPKSNQAGNEFTFSINEDLQEPIKYLSKDFPISVYTQSYCHAASDYIPLHWHNELQILWVAEGELEYSVNGSSFRLGANRLLMINHHQLHGSRTVSEDTKTLCINFTPEIFHPMVMKDCILPMLESDFFSCFLLLLQPHHIAVLEKFLNWKGEPLWYFSVMNFLSQIFEDILNTYTEHADPQNDEEIRQIRAMLSFIHTHYAQPLTVRQISDQAIINKNRCTALFRKYTGLSPIKYVNEYRLYTAKNLITHTDRSISDISADVGYNQISHFIEQFRNSYGLSPLKYRNRFGDRQRPPV